MKGKLVMKCRPEGDGVVVKSIVALKDVDGSGKLALMRTFLSAIELDHETAARYLTLIASGVFKGERRCERREATETIVDE